MSSEVQDLISAIESLHDNDKMAMLQDIANDLSAIKSDFQDSVNYDMSLILGEIYRQKIKDIFDILEKHGVK